MANHNRHFDGKTVHITIDAPDHDHRTVEIALTPGTASELSRMIARLRATTMLVGPEIAELHEGLRYVMDGASAETGQMQVIVPRKVRDPSQGNDPLGDWNAQRVVTHSYWPTQSEVHGEFVCGWADTASGGICGLPSDAHPR